LDNVQACHKYDSKVVIFWTIWRQSFFISSWFHHCCIINSLDISKHVSQAASCQTSQLFSKTRHHTTHTRKHTRMLVCQPASLLQSETCAGSSLQEKTNRD
jgi:hypothetical protein